MQIALLIIFLMPFNAYAYIGPGLGIGTIGAVFGVILSIFIALLAIVWYPFKRLLKKMKKKKSGDDDSVSS